MDITLTQLIVLALAVYRICRLLIEDTILEGPREKFFNKFPPSTKVGYVLTCYWCLGIWVASLVVLVCIIVPVLAMWAALVLALSASAGIIAAQVNR
jgi:hypothetical protein